VVSKPLKVEITGAKPKIVPKGTPVEIVSVDKKAIVVRAGELTGRVRPPAALARQCVRPKLAKGGVAPGLPDLPPMPDDLPPLPPPPDGVGPSVAASGLPGLPPSPVGGPATSEPSATLGTAPVPPPPGASGATRPGPTVPPAAVEPPRPAVRQGALSISATEDGASVTIDGSPAGTTPLSRLTLAEGPHRLHVEKPGYTHFDTEVVIKADGTQSVDALLTPLPGSLPAPSRGGNRRLLGMTITGGGVVALGAAAVTFLVAGSQASSLKTDIATYNAAVSSGGATAAQYSSLVDRRKKVARLDAITLTAGVLGLAGVGVGSVLWATAPTPKSSWSSVSVGAVPLAGGPGGPGGLLVLSGGF
jgi:hypothetical protein